MDDKHKTVNTMLTPQHPEAAWRSDERDTALELAGLVLAGNSNLEIEWTARSTRVECWYDCEGTA